MFYIALQNLRALWHSKLLIVASEIPVNLLSRPYLAGGHPKPVSFEYKYSQYHCSWPICFLSQGSQHTKLSTLVRQDFG